MLSQLVRKNVLNLQPYSSARDEYTQKADVYIDANENPYPSLYNRYPDPYQKELKNAISEWKSVPVENIFLGNGSDEIIDLLIRAFCEPNQDSILALNPSYGMYTVSANINNVEVRYFNLDENFQLVSQELLKHVIDTDKLLFICSPNNPSGNTFSDDEIISICRAFNGLVIVDEAYIDFATNPSLNQQVHLIHNLVVIQTMSKAMGAAGIRLGMGFMDPYVVKILNKIKPPYNINEATQHIAKGMVKDRNVRELQVTQILETRDILFSVLQKLTFVQSVFPSEANFILCRVENADDLYQYLLNLGIVSRNRNKQYRCAGCIRFTIGTPDENKTLIEALSSYTYKT